VAPDRRHGGPGEADGRPSRRPGRSRAVGSRGVVGRGRCDRWAPGPRSFASGARHDGTASWYRSGGFGGRRPSHRSGARDGKARRGLRGPGGDRGPTGRSRRLLGAFTGPSAGLVRGASPSEVGALWTLTFPMIFLVFWL
jgi:hypothetical protein